MDDVVQKMTQRFAELGMDTNILSDLVQVCPVAACPVAHADALQNWEAKIIAMNVADFDRHGHVPLSSVPPGMVPQIHSSIQMQVSSQTQAMQLQQLQNYQQLQNLSGFPLQMSPSRTNASSPPPYIQQQNSQQYNLQQQQRMMHQLPQTSYTDSIQSNQYNYTGKEDSGNYNYSQNIGNFQLPQNDGPADDENVIKSNIIPSTGFHLQPASQQAGLVVARPATSGSQSRPVSAIDQLSRQDIDRILLNQVDAGHGSNRLCRRNQAKGGNGKIPQLDGNDDDDDEDDPDDPSGFGAQSSGAAQKSNGAASTTTAPGVALTAGTPIGDADHKVSGSGEIGTGGDSDINSDLDDDDDDEHVETPNLILCLYEKVQRVKNKWKCSLKDGVGNINGKDYLFSRATCEFQW